MHTVYTLSFITVIERVEFYKRITESLIMSTMFSKNKLCRLKSMFVCALPHH